MQRTLIALALASGCEFHSTVTSTDAVQPIDAAASPDSLIDAPSGICIGRFVLVCRPAVPGNLAFLGMAATINTDLDPRCVLQSQGTGAPQLCVMTGNDIRIDAKITVIGSHPLVLAAFRDLNITMKGNLILTSPRGMMPGAGANDPACQPPTAGGNGAAGAGGGAGGSYRGTGGAGGSGDVGGTATGGVASAPITPIVRVAGGCKGSQGGDGGPTAGGAPGNGGGAVMLIAARKLTLDGLVSVGGGGGDAPAALAAGGGGGGSGGFVGMDGMTYAITGQVTANGGGGASGGGTLLAGVPGNDGAASTTIAAAGGMAPIGGGAGGNGSIAAQTSGLAGQGALNGGGGGGGGAGVILVKGAAPAGGSFSPPLTIVP